MSEFSRKRIAAAITRHAPGKENAMHKMEKHMELLGMRVVDKVTSFEGVVTSICFDLYGCIQALVHPGISGEGKLLEQQWFDVNRLGLTSSTPVMRLPNYADGRQAEGRQGAAEKPKTNAA